MLELGAEKPILMPHQMLDTLIQIGEASGNPEIQWTPFANLLRTAVEAVVASPSITMVSRWYDSVKGWQDGGVVYSVDAFLCEVVARHIAGAQ
jgi:hypothetical protein